MISTKEALEHLLALVAPLGVERVPLAVAAGRVLAEPAIAARDQPPFAASAMDGYAVPQSSVAPGAQFRVIGEAAAGHAFDGSVSDGQAVRIFTGAPLPNGAKRVIIQEDVTRDGAVITLGNTLDAGLHIRPAGGDFKRGDQISAPRRLRPADIALLASMNIPDVSVAIRPRIGLIATGDELVMPGEDPRADQIIASNNFGLKAMFEASGAQTRLLPIARDNPASLSLILGLAEGADLIVTIGGASVGDHDIVAEVAGGMGLERAFYKVAMRPGKPLMAGRFGPAAMVGLPGNPVSSMVCGEIFIRPMIDLMLGLPTGPRPRVLRPLREDLDKNGLREHYMRGVLDADGQVTALARQDSSLLGVLAEANCLIVRPPHDPAQPKGTMVETLLL